MLLGIYRSFEELEEHLTIREMNLLLMADAKKSERLHRVLAAVNGIKWGDESEAGSAEDVVEQMKKKAQLRADGIEDEEELDLAAMGIKFG